MKLGELKELYISRQTIVYIFETDQEWQGEKVYIIKTANVKTRKEYYRFGNQTQALSILNTYRHIKRFEL